MCAVFTEARGHRALTPSRQLVAENCLQARGSRQAFPADTFTQRNSLLARDQLCLAVAVGSSLRRTHLPRDTLRRSLRAPVRYPGVPLTRPTSFSRASSLNRAVHELQDRQGRTRYMLQTSADHARGGSGPAARDDRLSAPWHDHVLQIHDDPGHAQARWLSVCALGCGVWRTLGGGMRPLQYLIPPLSLSPAARDRRRRLGQRRAGARSCARCTCT